MNALSYLFWLVEVLLEVAGARQARKRSAPLSIFLSFRAFADIACLGISAFAGPFFYSWSWYAQALIQYILFTVLSMYVCAKLLRSDRYTLRFYSAAAGTLSFLAIAFFHARPFTMTNVLHFAACTYMLLAVCLCLALAMQKNVDWSWIGIAALLLATSNGLLSAMQAAHWQVMSYYPIGEIAALGLWVWATRKEPSMNIEGEVRLSLPVCFGAESATMAAEQDKWIM
jgi:hypothetical protein